LGLVVDWSEVSPVLVMGEHRWVLPSKEVELLAAVEAVLDRRAWEARQRQANAVARARADREAGLDR
jgi:hypothetical protein